MRYSTTSVHVFRPHRRCVNTKRTGACLMRSDFGVPQSRPRIVFVALREDLDDSWSWLDLPATC